MEPRLNTYSLSIVADAWSTDIQLTVVDVLLWLQTVMIDHSADVSRVQIEQ